VFKEQIPVTTPKPPGYCPNGTREFGSYCYRFDTSIKSFPEAKYDCESRGN
jgi:hypothetical protein